MSALQTRAKPLVLPMARGDKIVLTPADQRVLAAWIAMATITSEFFNPETAAIAQADREKVWHYTTPPDDWKIWIGDFRRTDWVPYRVHNVLEISPNEAADRTGIHHLRTAIPNTQMTTLVFGRLYAHAVSSQIPDVVARLQFPRPVTKKILRRIWPPFSRNIAWPPRRAMTDRDADSAAGYLFLKASGLLWKPPRIAG